MCHITSCDIFPYVPYYPKSHITSLHSIAFSVDPTYVSKNDSTILYQEDRSIFFIIYVYHTHLHIVFTYLIKNIDTKFVQTRSIVGAEGRMNY